MIVPYFFEGDCTSDETLRNIKKQFIKTLNSSRYNLACSSDRDECNIENVRVIMK